MKNTLLGIVSSKKTIYDFGLQDSIWNTFIITQLTGSEYIYREESGLKRDR